MAILNEYNSLIRENFNISDAKTRKTIIALEDAEQTQLLAALSSALYDKIVKKVDKIDFGSIPRSRGDITKVEGFENTMECLNIIRRLVVEYKEDTVIVDNVLSAVENVKSRKGIFVKAYSLNMEFPMVFYNLITMAIEQSVSFLIATCIQYIKDPASQTMNLALDKVSYNNSRDNMLYEQLADFNKSCLGKEFDDVLENIMKGRKFQESFEYNCGDSRDYECHDKEFEYHHGHHHDDRHNFKNDEFEYRHGHRHDCEDIENRHGYRHDDRQECGPEDGQNCPVMDRMPQDYEQIPINGSAEEEVPVPVEEFTISTIATIAAGVGIGAVALSLGLKGLRFLIKALIPIIRNTTYFFINSRVKLSDALAVQAQLIEANAYNLQYSTNSTLDEDNKKKVVEKQLKIAEKLKNWSNKISIDSNKAKKQAAVMVADDSKQKTIDDIKDQLPPDIVDKSGDLF